MLFYYPNPKHILNQNNLTKVMDGILTGYGGGELRGVRVVVYPRQQS